MCDFKVSFTIMGQFQFYHSYLELLGLTEIGDMRQLKMFNYLHSGQLFTQIFPDTDFFCLISEAAS